MKDSGQGEQHRWTGTSETRLVDGQVVLKKVTFAGFALSTVIAFSGLAVMVGQAHGSWPLHVLGAALALGGTVASYTYRAYSHWFGVVVVLAIALTFLEHLTADL